MLAEKISTELLGVNPEFHVLKRVRTVPWADSGRVLYRDNYTRELNKQSPFDLDVDASAGATLSMSSAKDLHVPFLAPCFYNILMNSSTLSEWQPLVIYPQYTKDKNFRTAENYLAKVAEYKECLLNERTASRNFLVDLAKGENDGLAFPINYRGKVVIIPSQKAVEFFLERAGKVKGSI